MDAHHPTSSPTRWIQDKNARAILDRQPSFKCVDVMPELFGNAFGSAREKHVRKALIRLQKNGFTNTDLSGPLQDKMIVRS